MWRKDSKAVTRALYKIKLKTRMMIAEKSGTTVLFMMLATRKGLFHWKRLRYYDDAGWSTGRHLSTETTGWAKKVSLIIFAITVSIASQFS